MSKDNIRLDEEIVAVITAAVSVYMGHENFTVRSIKPSVPELGKLKLNTGN